MSETKETVADIVREMRNCDRFKDSCEVLKAWDGGLEGATDIVRMLDWLLAPCKAEEGGGSSRADGRRSEDRRLMVGVESKEAGMSIKRIYIAGPMSGKPGYNYSAFFDAAERLRKQEWWAINPFCIGQLFGSLDEIRKSFDIMYKVWGKEFPEECRLARAVTDAELAAVRSCDAIYLLRGWEKSKGAKKELAEAIAHGLEVLLEV